MTQSFDVNAFVQGGVAFAMPTQQPLLPQDDYPATCTDYKVVPPEGDRSPILEVYWRFDPNPAFVGTPTRRQSIFLDVDEQGRVIEAPDKNVSLGGLRNALGQNVPGQPWSPEMLRNARALCRVRHSKDGRFDNVVSVAPLTTQAGQMQPPAQQGWTQPPPAPAQAAQTPQGVQAGYAAPQPAPVPQGAPQAPPQPFPDQPAPQQGPQGGNAATPPAGAPTSGSGTAWGS